MITIKLKIKSCTDFDYITQKQLNYSFAFRLLYNHINLINDTNYLFNIKKLYILNDIEIRSLISEVKTKFNLIKTGKEKLETNIVNINNEIKNLLTLPKSNKLNRKLFNLNKNLVYKNKILSKDIVFGKLSLLRKLSYLNNNKSKNHNEIIKTKQEYQNNRILPIYLLGEANQKGNRFILFDLLNNKIVYKPNIKTKINIDFAYYTNYIKQFTKLQELINNKGISVSIRLSKEYLYLIYDEEVLNGYNLDINERTKEVNIIKNNHIDKETKSILIKEIYKKYYTQQELKKLENKLNNRYISFDLNLDYIGCSILDKVNDKYNIIYCFNYDLSELNNLILNKSCDSNEQFNLNNKRRHGICHVWKDLFEIAKYYNCGYLVLEDLEFKSNKDFGNHISNKKVNNIWYRELSNNLINKYCNINGIIILEINPCYTSFIGNINNEFIDPVNAAIEIGRRGIYKYTKNSFYPEFEIGTIMNAMSNLNKMRDVSVIKDCGNWIEVYRKVKESGLRYRATRDDCKKEFRIVNNIIHSRIKKISYLENNIKLNKEGIKL